MTDRVRDLMTEQRACVQSDTSVVECAMQMMDHGFRFLPVVDEGEVTGLVDDSGVFGCGVLLEDALWFSFSPEGPDSAAEVATGAVSVDADADLASGLKALRQLGAAVVLHEGEVVGVLSEHDIVRLASTRLPSDGAVEEVASTPVHTVDSQTTAHDAIGQMRDLGIRHLVVADGGVAQGVVSLRDLVEGWRGSNEAVKRCMQPELKTVEPGTSLQAAAVRMVDEQIGCLPILDAEGRPTHILTRRDVLRAVGSALQAGTLRTDA